MLEAVLAGAIYSVIIYVQKRTKPTPEAFDKTKFLSTIIVGEG